MSRPDIISKEEKLIWEIKPITHMNSTKYISSDRAQLDRYISESRFCYEIGDPNLLVISSKRYGYIYDDNSDEWEVKVWTNPEREGMIYYSLKRTGSNKLRDFIEDVLRDLQKGPDPNKIIILPTPWGLLAPV